MSNLNLETILKGEFGNEYSFSLYGFQTSFRPISAVYLIGRLSKDATNYTLLYIGQTNDLSVRFKDHHKKTSFERNGANMIGILQLDNKGFRDMIEKDLISTYKPICNEQLI